jgi:hypothetical protein
VSVGTMKNQQIYNFFQCEFKVVFNLMNHQHLNCHMIKRLKNLTDTFTNTPTTHTRNR